jgi:hypothetical protein
MGGGYHGPFQPSWIRRVATASEAEQQGEHDVSARRSWTATAVVAEFQHVKDGALGTWPSRRSGVISMRRFDFRDVGTQIGQLAVRTAARQSAVRTPPPRLGLTGVVCLLLTACR